MPLDKHSLIQYRLERCDETIEDARIAIDNNRLHNAENRIYYAIFYVVSALAIKYDFSTSKHWNLLAWFNKNFVKTNIIDKKYSATYKNAFERRQEGDYDDFIDFGSPSCLNNTGYITIEAWVYVDNSAYATLERKDRAFTTYLRSDNKIRMYKSTPLERFGY